MTGTEDGQRDNERQRFEISDHLILEKTLNAGSMRKLRLATHKVTSEELLTTDADVGFEDADSSTARDQP